MFVEPKLNFVQFCAEAITDEDITGGNGGTYTGGGDDPA